MADITLTIADSDVPNYIQAFVDTYHYLPTLDNNQPNPETPDQFAVRMISQYMQDVFQSWNIQQRIKAAQTPQPSDTVQVTASAPTLATILQASQPQPLPPTPAQPT